MEWDKRDSFGFAEESANRIRQPENEQLKKLFMELVKYQALLYGIYLYLNFFN
jgi:hypothetical protein